MSQLPVSGRGALSGVGRVTMSILPERYWPVSDVGVVHDLAAGVPEAMRKPPFLPAPGPRSRT